MNHCVNDCTKSGAEQFYTTGYHCFDDQAEQESVYCDENLSVGDDASIDAHPVFNDCSDLCFDELGSDKATLCFDMVNGSLDDDASESSETDQVQPNIFMSNPAHTCFRFLHWNVNGLLSKLSISNFISHISNFDFVCLVETFVENVNLNVFSDFQAFIKPSVKLFVAGRPSGGVICLVKNNIAPYVKEIKVEMGFFCYDYC